MSEKRKADDAADGEAKRQKTSEDAESTTGDADKTAPLSLGAFSVSLAVKNIKASIEFYQKLGFVQVHGAVEQRYVIMRSGSTNIGLFEGMFESNILTFNPGWDQQANPVEGEFTDVRKLQQHYKDQGLKLKSETSEDGQGPASIMLEDPDGNTILVDQHV
eukprot:TRINITY_DN16003_c0_g1_i1.p1 TRINITY_DN16003_c0_g1~~TRINITY_DN16003_c0_g1_i1.p1  ORF type:complete len:161 (-),score=40.49 TRINITY_DN16003_c0_g1_i1:137-619(-)